MGTTGRTRNRGLLRRARLALSSAGLAVVAAAAVAGCGPGEDGQDPPVIRLGSGGPGTATEAMADSAAAEVDRAGAMPEVLPWPGVEYEFTIADSARVDAGEAPAWRLEPPADLRAAADRLADGLDLDGVAESPHGDGSLHAGELDGSGPALWVGPRGHWNYSDPSGARGVSCVEPDRPATDDHDGASSEEADRAEASAADGDEPATLDRVECEPPEPPTGVPTADEAQSRASALFESLDLPGSLTLMESDASDWGAWAHAQLEVGGQPSGVPFSAGFGGDGLLTAASGTLAEPVEVGDYPTVDAETAVGRLGERNLAWRGPALHGAAPDTAAADRDAPVSSAPDASVDDPADPPPGERLEPEEHQYEEPAPKEPEVVAVTLVDAEAIVMQVVDADGTVWLLPAYRFTSEDGAAWQALAVADGYLELDGPAEDEPGDDEPAPEPDPGDGAEPGEPGDGGGAADPGEPGTGMEAVAEEVVGLSEEEATDLIESSGGVARVVSRDGEDFAVTEDYRTDRVNLRVEDGRVVDASVG